MEERGTKFVNKHIQISIIHLHLREMNNTHIYRCIYHWYTTIHHLHKLLFFEKKNQNS